MSWLGKKAADIVTSGQQLVNGTVTAVKLATGAAIGNIVDGTIAGAKLAAGAVVSHLGYTPLIGDGHLANGADLNAVLTSGVYRVEGSTSNLPTSAANYGQLLVMRGLDTITQIYGDYMTGAVYTRSGNPPVVGGGGSWSAWQAATSIGAGGQSWQAPTRAAGTTYTNSTGRPIYVVVACTSNPYAALDFYINGTIVLHDQGGGAGYTNYAQAFYIIPNGATYSVSGVVGSLNYWWELR